MPQATFNISVWHSSKYVVLSNMPEMVEKDDDRKRRKRLVKERTILTRFQETPPMSTYLVAFAVGELPYFFLSSKRIRITLYEV